MKELEGIRIPIMALRGISVFPKLIFSFDVGREKSIRALDEAMSGDQHMILLMQKDVIVDEPAPEDLYDVGVLVHVRQVLKMPGEIIRILVEGLERVWVEEFTQESPYLEGKCVLLQEERYRNSHAKVDRKSVV